MLRTKKQTLKSKLPGGGIEQLKIQTLPRGEVSPANSAGINI